MGANRCDRYGMEWPRTFTKGREGLSALINTYQTCFLSWTRLNGAVLVCLRCSLEDWKPANPTPESLQSTSVCLLELGISSHFDFPKDQFSSAVPLWGPSLVGKLSHFIPGFTFSVQPWWNGTHHWLTGRSWNRGKMTRWSLCKPPNDRLSKTIT